MKKFCRSAEDILASMRTDEHNGICRGRYAPAELCSLIDIHLLFLHLDVLDNVSRAHFLSAKFLWNHENIRVFNPPSHWTGRLDIQ